jgi:hypothetical protein
VRHSQFDDPSDATGTQVIMEDDELQTQLFFTSGTDSRRIISKNFDLEA